MIRLLPLLLLTACQTPDLPPPPVAESARSGPINLQQGLNIVAPKDAAALRAELSELFVLRQELPFTRRLVLLRRQERAIWRRRVEKREATLQDLMPISRAYQEVSAEQERLTTALDELQRKLATRLKRPAATLELELSGVIRDPGSIHVDLESLLQIAQSRQPERDEVEIAREVRQRFEDLAATTHALAEFAGDTIALVRGLQRDLQTLDELVPDDRVETEIQLVSTRLHGLKLLRAQQRAILALEAVIGQPLVLGTEPHP
jgi:hypothetical protein